MAKRGGLSSDDERVWRHVMSTVKPLHPVAPKAGQGDADQHSFAAMIGEGRAETGRHSVQARPSKRALSVHTSRPLSQRQSSQRVPLQDQSGQRAVRRGKVAIGGTLDLHGCTQVDAQQELARFVALMRSRGASAALVITGKGRPVDLIDDYMTPQPGAIRRNLPSWLAAPMIRHHVAGYAPAHPRHGGSGAYYVLLKRPDR